ncbi:hypothetical protein AUK22_00555 [bacterium CG2_30_54_10]|nr:MAG: hypothetical protein AUK22_00555 [bacterium CG2_30_54_10]
MDLQTLKKLFKDRDKMVRLFCLKTALRDHLSGIEEFLREGLRDERPDVVVAALKGAASVEDPEITGMTLTYLESPNLLLRTEALSSLEGKRSAQVKSALCEFLKREEDTNLLASAIKIIGKYKSIEFLPLLKAFLTFEDERVRANAVESLGDIDDPEVPEILKALVSDRNNRVRANAIKGLWEKGIRFGLNTLPDELRSPNPRKRASVAYILGIIKEERSLDLLLGLLGDISPTVRNRAILSLGKIGSSRAISHLLSAYAKEEETGVRDNIVASCISINVDLSVSRLTEKFAGEEDARIRANLVKSVGDIKQPKTVVLLSRALHDADSRVRANAIEAIAAQGESTLSELLFPLLNDSHNRVRSNAAAALWKLGGMGAIITLKQMLRSSHKQMRASAAWALGEIGALQFSDLLQDLSADTDPDVRKCALKALAKVAKIA